MPEPTAASDGRTAIGAPVAPIPFRLGRRPCIDGIRGLASLLVLGYHLAILSGRINAPAFGFNGVFFVLSGFLITAMLVEEWRKTDRIDLRRFLLRRAIRLLPCLLLVLAAAAIVYAAADVVGYDAQSLTNEESSGRWLTIVASLSLMTNWALAFGWVEPGMLRGSWSLAVEQQFYLLWPPVLLLLLTRRISLRRVAAIAAACTVAVIVYRETLWQTGASWSRVYFGADARADSILIGCAIGLLAADNLLPTNALFRGTLRAAAALTGLVLALLIALLFMPIYGTFSPVDDITVRLMAPVALMTGLVLVHLVIEPGGISARLLSAGWLGIVGRLSYPIYLWHTFYLWLRIKLFGYGDGPVLAVLALTAISAPLTYYGVELPVMRLKSRFSAAPTVSAPAVLLQPTERAHGAASPRALRRLPRTGLTSSLPAAVGVDGRPRARRFDADLVADEVRGLAP